MQNSQRLRLRDVLAIGLILALLISLCTTVVASYQDSSASGGTHKTPTPVAKKNSGLNASSTKVKPKLGYTSAIYTVTTNVSGATGSLDDILNTINSNTTLTDGVEIDFSPTITDVLHSNNLNGTYTIQVPVFINGATSNAGKVIFYGDNSDTQLNYALNTAVYNANTSSSIFKDLVFIPHVPGGGVSQQTGITQPGFKIVAGNNNTLDNVQFSDTTPTTFSFFDYGSSGALYVKTTGNTIKNSSFNNSVVCIELANSSNTVTNTAFQNCGYVKAYVTSSGTATTADYGNNPAIKVDSGVSSSQIISNTFSDIGGAAVSVTGPSVASTQILSNTISSFNSASPILPDGFVFTNQANSLTVNNNTVSSARNAIAIDQSSNYTVKGNVITNNVCSGIKIGDPKGSTNGPGNPSANISVISNSIVLTNVTTQRSQQCVDNVLQNTTDASGIWLVNDYNSTTPQVYSNTLSANIINATNAAIAESSNGNTQADAPGPNQRTIGSFDYYFANGTPSAPQNVSVSGSGSSYTVSGKTGPGATVEIFSTAQQYQYTASVIDETGASTVVTTVSAVTGLLATTTADASGNFSAGVSAAAGTYIALTATYANNAGTSELSPPVSLSPSPTLAAGPSPLVLTATVGSSATGTIFITATNGSVTYTPTISYQSGSGWLSLNPTGSGTLNSQSTTISANASAASLAVGVYTATVTFNTSNPTNNPTVTVVFNVVASPTLSATPTSLIFTTTVSSGGATSTTSPQTINVTASSGSIPYTVVTSTTSSNFFSVTPTSGTATTTPTAHTVSIGGATLPAGNYSGTITFQDSNTPSDKVVVNVSYTVIVAPSPQLFAAPSSLSFTYTTGSGSTPASQSVNVTATNGPVNYTVVTSTNGSNWFAVSPTSGTTPGSHTVSVVNTSLPAGTYTGTITFQDTNIVTDTATVSLQYVVSSGPVLSVSPNSLVFNAVAGSGSNPASQNVTLSANTNSINFTSTVAITTTSNWLGISPSSGTASVAGSNVTFNVTNNLTPGIYTGTVTFYNATNSTDAPKTVTVTFNVTAPIPPSLSVNPTSLNFSAQQGNAPAQQSVSLTANNGAVTYTVSTIYTPTTAGTWLTVSSSGGTIAANSSQTINFTPSALATPGTYQALVTFTDANNPNDTASVLVTYTVAPPPTLTVAPTSLSFTAPQNGSPSPTQQTATLTVTNGPANFTSTVSYDPGSGTTQWLSYSPLGGTVSSNSTITFVINTTNLPVGIYTATVTFQNQTNPSDTPQVVTVTLNITTPPPPTLSLSTNSLSFSATTGGSASPPSQSVTVKSSNSTSLNFTTGVVYGSGASGWLTISPTSGTATNSGSLVNFSVNNTNLPAGTYTASVTFTNTTNTNDTPQTLQVTFTVSNQTQLAFLSINPTSLSFTSPTNNFNAQSQQASLIALNGPITYTSSISPTQLWLSYTPSSGSIQGANGGSQTVTVTVIVGTLAPGVYSSTITYQDVANPGDTAQLIVTLTVTGSTPTPTPTAGATPTPTSGGGITPTPTSGGGITPTPTSGGGITPTPTSGGGITPTPTSGGGITPTPTSGGGNTPTPTSGGGITPTPTSVGGNTPTPTGGGNNTPTATSGSGTRTPTPTNRTPTATPTRGGGGGGSNPTATPTRSSGGGGGGGSSNPTATPTASAGGGSGAGGNPTPTIGIGVPIPEGSSTPIVASGGTPTPTPVIVGGTPIATVTPAFPTLPGATPTVVLPVTPVANGPLSLAISPSSLKVNSGSTVELVIQITNTTDQTVQNVMFTSSVPAQLRVTSVSPTDSTSVSNNFVIYQGASIAPGATVTIKVEAVAQVSSTSASVVVPGTVTGVLPDGTNTRTDANSPIITIVPAGGLPVTGGSNTVYFTGLAMLALAFIGFRFTRRVNRLRRRQQ